MTIVNGMMEPTAGETSHAEQLAVPARVRLYDYLRGFALLTVILIHVLAGYLSNRTTVLSPDWALTFDHLLHYAVPMFVFISGALVWGRIREWSLEAYRTFLRRRLFVIVVPYFAWSTLYYLLRPTANVGQFPASTAAAVRQFLQLLLNGHIWYHLYFVPMIVLFYFLTPLAQMVLKRSPEALLLGVLAIRVFFGPSIVLAFEHYVQYDVLKPFLVDVVEHMSFMAMGGWYAMRAGAIRHTLERAWPAILALGVAMWPIYTMGEIVIRNAYAERVYEFVAIGALIMGFAGAFLAFEHRKSRPGERSRMLAELSYGAYLAHPLIIFTMRKSVGWLGIGTWWDNLVFVACFFAIVVGVTLTLVWGLSRLPLARHVV